MTARASAPPMPLLWKEERFGELIAFAAITAIGGFLVVTAGQYSVIDGEGMIGGGFLPFIAGVTLSVLGGLQLIATAGRVRALAGDRARLERNEAERREEAALPDAFGRTGKQRLHQLGLVTVALIASIALAPLVGLLGALTLLSIYISAFIERRSWWASIAISLASVGLVYLIFVVLLGVPLPGGLLFDSLFGG